MSFLPRTSTAVMAGALLLTLVSPVAAAAEDDTTAADHAQTTIVGPVEPAPARTTAAACAAPCFTFNGRGSHHSVGLSQYGARGQAQEGRNETQITQTYYSGTRIETRSAPYDIRVAVVRDTPAIRYQARGGAAALYFTDRGPATIADGGFVEVTAQSNGTCLTVADGLRHEAGCPAIDPTGHVEVQVPDGDWQRGSSFDEAPAGPWGRYRAYGQDAIVRSVLDQLGSGTFRLDIVVELSLETYLYGLAEVPYSWESEALQAQAIAGRSFALHRMLDTGQFPDRGCSCHVWDSQQDQVYAGYDREVSARWADWKTAVDATAQRVVTAAPGQTGYGDTADGIVQTFYSASSHGRTESKHESPAFSSARWDYMLTVRDDWSLQVGSNPYAAWSREIPASTIAARVGLSAVDRVEVTERTSSGSARTVRFTGGGTTKTYTANQVRGMFALPSNAFGIGNEVWGDPPPPSDLFPDDDGSPHEADIDWLANQGITRGCNPPKNTLFCPDATVTRGQMAAFLVRALNLPPGSGSFQDTKGNTFEADIAALARAGITKGCNPPANTRYCPGDPVTRDQMASFLQRALGLPNGPRGVFRDVPSGSTHERAIGALQQARVTLGCNPPTNDRYCPASSVTRAQMASFLRRGLG